MEEAKKAAVFALPPREKYENAPKDMIMSLQRRDLKLATSINSKLIQELGDDMLPTTIIPLSVQEASAILNSYTQEKIENCKEEDQKHLFHIVNRIDKAIKPIVSNEQPKFFIKLSFMSPKDVTVRVSNENTVNTVKNELKHLMIQLNYKRNISLHSCAITRVWLNSLYKTIGVYNGKEAVECLIQSYRIHDELNDSLQVPEYYANTEIIIRPWLPIRPGFEFRIFVSNKIVTAISQYESIYYPEVWSERNIIIPKIFTFVSNNIIPKLESRLPSFVVDVVLLCDNDNIFVCELNPFASSTSSCLFLRPEDKNLLLIGPSEARVVPPPSFKNVGEYDNGERIIRFSNVDINNNVENKDNIIKDYGMDEFGLKLSSEWEEIIGNYWKENLPVRRSLFLIPAVLALFLSVVFFLYIN